MKETRRRSLRVILSSFMVASVFLGSPATAGAENLLGPKDDSYNDRQRKEGTGIRLCTPDEISFIKNGESASASGTSGSSGTSEPSGEQAWLTEGTEEFERAQKIYDYWTGKIGVSGAFAAGVLANVKQETGGTFDPRMSQGFGKFESKFAKEPSSGGPGGGLYQFDPYSKYTNSPIFAKGGWEIEPETDFVWLSEFVTGGVEAGMKNAPSQYGVDVPYHRVWTAIPTDNGKDFRVALDPGALATSTDPVKASKGFQVGYERPALYHTEREDDAEAANKVFNPHNFKGDPKKLKENLPATAGAQTVGSMIDSIGKLASGALDPNKLKYRKHPMFTSPCRLPSGDVIRDQKDAQDFIEKVCKEAPGSRSSRKHGGGGGAAGGEGLLNEEHLQPDTVKLGKALLKEFPEIKTIGGWRPADAFPDHPSGNSLDVMMPNGPYEDSELGRDIEDWVWEHAYEYNVTYTIFEQKSTTVTGTQMMEDRGDYVQNHFDHVHITQNMFEEKGMPRPKKGEKIKPNRDIGPTGAQGDGVGSGSGSGSGSGKRGGGHGGKVNRNGMVIDCGSAGDDTSSSSKGDLKTDNDVIIPVDGTITELYGPKSDRNHSGIDIANKRGTPIYAAVSGEVIDAGPADGYGLWLRVKTDDGYITEYGHQFRNLVEVGDHVKVGQHVADMNSGGFSTGDHLHLTVWSPEGEQIDAGEWLKDNGADWPDEYGAQVSKG